MTTPSLPAPKTSVWQNLGKLMGSAPDRLPATAPEVASSVHPTPGGDAAPRQVAPPVQGIWGVVSAQVDLNNYRPQRITDVVVSRLVEGADDAEARYIIKNPTTGTYLQLSQSEWVLWRLMDGQHTVRDLVITYFMRFGQFAYGRVMSLVHALRENHFLQDPPFRLYEQVARALAAREAGSWGRRILQAFVQSEYFINGLDGYFGAMYRVFGWLFWRPVQALLVLLVLAGLVAFAVLYQAGASIISLSGSYALGVVVLIIANFVVLIIHEHAHALTTKHFRRELRRGGFMMYYGFPAFFVDTMDIWLEPKWPRIAVTAAGPLSNLVIGACASLAALAAPALGLSDLAGQILFKIATVAYVGAFVNLNPLLELDGYFILIDWLEIPMLRQRSFDYLRRRAGEVGHSVMARLSRHSVERVPDNTAPRMKAIFTAFGGLAFGYSVYVMWVALYFWQTRMWSALQGIWAGASTPWRIVLVALVLALLAPPLWALVQWAWRQGERALEWLAVRGFFDHNRNLALIVAAVCGLTVGWGVVAPGQRMLGDNLYLDLAPLCAFGAAAVGLGLTARQYRGSRFASVWWALGASTVGLACGALPGQAFMRAFAATDAPVLDTLAAIGVCLAPLGWVAAGLFAVAEHDLRRMLGWERAAMVILLVAAPLLGQPVGRWTSTAPEFMAFLAIFGAYGAPLGLALLLPTMASFGGTRFSVPWLTLGTALVLSTLVQGLLTIAPPAVRFPGGGTQVYVALRYGLLLAAALWASGALCAFLIGRRIQFLHTPTPERLALSDAERLRVGFAHFVETLFTGFAGAFGRRFARDIDDVLDILSVTADWDVEIDNGLVNDELDLTQMDVIAQGDRYREVLDALIGQMTERAGIGFMARMVAAAYDSLPWPEREALGRYVLAGAEWGRVLAQTFAGGQSDRLQLLRGVPFFATLSDEQYAILLTGLREETVAAGAVLGVQDQPATRLYIVAAGEIETWERPVLGAERLTRELRRGAYFGKQVVRAEGGIYSATYRASVTSRVLSVSREMLAPLWRHGGDPEQVQAQVEELMLLGRMPLFGGIGPQALATLHARMGRRTVAPGDVIIQQGEARSNLFIVLSGHVDVLARAPGGGEERITGRLGPGEHFGEYALLTDGIYGATVRAASELGARGVTLLTLDEATFDALVAGSTTVAHYVEQLASGRQIATRRQLNLAGLIG